MRIARLSIAILFFCALMVGGLFIAGCQSSPSSSSKNTTTSKATSTSAAKPAIPRADHVVIVVEENRSFADVIGNPTAPYINSLARSGANFTNSHAVTHPSEPNYLALFSGSTQGLVDDSCPHTYSGDNLGAQLIQKRLRFIGYSESMPFDGFTGCQSGAYARKHNPWVNFTNVPASSNRTFNAFPTDSKGFAKLPTVSIVVPNLDNDMHDGSVAQGDAWLKNHMDAYIRWAKTHNSLLILTFDEDAGNTASNQIPTVFIGQRVKPGSYSNNINHYNLLRTIEDMYGLRRAGNAAAARPITSVWTVK